MDPNVLLDELRETAELVTRIYLPGASDAYELAEKFQALDQWLSKGGFGPSDWS